MFFISRYFNKHSLLLVFSFLVLSSCVTRKEIDYFQQPDQEEGTVTMLPVFEPVIKTNDILTIQVASINAEAAKFFNPSDNPDGASDPRLTAYLVDLNGEIEIPLVGKMKVAGLTTRMIRDSLRTKLEKYLQSPTVRVNFDSYSVTVLGEVKVPGMYYAKSEKFTITDALGFAGDLSIFGDRKKVMIIREQNGKKEFMTIDLTKRDIFNSPYYYLHPGDVVYVPAGKGRIASADTFYRIAPIALSVMTLIVLILYRVTN
jgi:polysaccharide biosynthesis/export protein